jgi:hypothetical protein
VLTARLEWLMPPPARDLEEQALFDASTSTVA